MSYEKEYLNLIAIREEHNFCNNLVPIQSGLGFLTGLEKLGVALAWRFVRTCFNNICHRLYKKTNKIAVGLRL